jgi:hypothetical protein
MPFRKKRKMRPHGAVALLKTRALRIEFATTRRRLVELEAVLAAAHGAYQKHTAIAAKDGSVERSTAYFHRVADFLDLLLEPNEADEAIGNLEELYIRRFATNPHHARRWLFAQAVWIVFGRATDMLHRFMRARAGK